jgi:signal transduction histidine kinase
MTEGADLQAALDDTLASVGSFTDWPMLVLWTPDAAGDLRLAALWASDEQFAAPFMEKCQGTVLHPGDCVAGRALKSKTIRRGDTDESQPCELCDAAEDIGLSASAAFPILYRKEVVGVLTCRVFEEDVAFERHVSTVATVTRAMGSMVTRRQIEQSYRETVEAVHRLNAQLLEFARLVSHDLQEPIRMVASFTKMLKTRLPPEDEVSLEYLQHALEGAARMEFLVRDLVRCVTLPLDHPRRAVPLDEILADVRGLLAGSIRRREAVIATDGPLPEVLSDNALMLSLFEQLISNSLKFSKQGRAPRIRISSEPSGEGYEISIDDNGIGIAEDRRSVVFEPFRRLNPRHLYPGTGMGLSIVRKIVEGHGGTIRIEDGTDGGIRVVLWLPGTTSRIGLGMAAGSMEDPQSE